MKKIKVIAAVIKNNEGKFFIAKRKEGKSLAGKWEFPGGKIEPKESPSDALMREIREELCIEIVVGEKIMTIQHKYPDYLLTMHTFFCFSETSVITMTEHTDYEWCIPSSLDKFDWLEADIPLIEKLSSSDV